MNKKLISCSLFLMTFFLLVGCGYLGEIKYEDAGIVKDVDGNTYKAIKIGKQIWMAENLKVKHYSNGDPIPEIADNQDWLDIGNNQEGAWCYYDNNPINDHSLGKLYNWYAVADERGICPSGWHVPSDSDWMILENYLGLPHNETKTVGIRGRRQNVGGQLKDTGTSHWISPNTRATNLSGFSGLPSGGRKANGVYYLGGFMGEWWTSTENEINSAFYRALGFDIGEIARAYALKHHGMAVRCVKDIKQK